MLRYGFSILLGILLFASSAKADVVVTCFQHTDADTDEMAMIVFDESDNTYWGKHSGQIHMDDAGYFAAFDTWLLHGRLQPTGNISFSTVTEVDGDTQFNTQAWSISKEGASAIGLPKGRLHYLKPAKCEGDR